MPLYVVKHCYWLRHVCSFLFLFWRTKNDVYYLTIWLLLSHVGHTFLSPRSGNKATVPYIMSWTFEFTVFTPYLNGTYMHINIQYNSCLLLVVFIVKIFVLFCRSFLVWRVRFEPLTFWSRIYVNSIPSKTTIHFLVCVFHFGELLFIYVYKKVWSLPSALSMQHLLCVWSWPRINFIKCQTMCFGSQ